MWLATCFLLEDPKVIFIEVPFPWRQRLLLSFCSILSICSAYWGAFQWRFVRMFSVENATKLCPSSNQPHGSHSNDSKLIGISWSDLKRNMFIIRLMHCLYSGKAPRTRLSGKPPTWVLTDFNAEHTFVDSERGGSGSISHSPLFFEIIQS